MVSEALFAIRVLAGLCLSSKESTGIGASRCL